MTIIKFEKTLLLLFFSATTDLISEKKMALTRASKYQGSEGSLFHFNFYDKMVFQSHLKN